MALTALTDDLDAAQMELTARLVAEAGGPKDVEKAIAAWQATDGHPIRRVDALIEELRGTSALDLSMIMVAARELRALTAG
jgi:NAD-specific glutamate dehydrogenase